MYNDERKSALWISGGKAAPFTRAEPPDRDGCEIKRAEALAFAKRVALVTTTSYSGIERRHEPRISTDYCASMQVLNPLLDGRLAIHVLDVSKSGLKIRSLMHLAKGTLVQIFIRNIVAMGEVRHCGKIGDEFHVGLQIEDVLLRHGDEEQPWNEALLNRES
jgi:hypothetical protein